MMDRGHGAFSPKIGLGILIMMTWDRSKTSTFLSSFFVVASSRFI